MPRLSIVIPVLGNTPALESTLLSVLGNRPADCEVLVVLATDYDDPYDLKDEVRFVAAEPGASYVECVNLGLNAAQSPIVHVLASGVEASEGWADAALEHFDDSRVAAVAPLVLHANQREIPLAAGVRYRAWGAREVNAPRTAPTAEGAARISVLGPCLTAAFYRLAAIRDAGGVSRAIGADLADVDLAIGLKRAGYRAVFESRSQLFAPELLEPPTSSFLRGLYAERLFWRNAGAVGWIRSLVCHPLYVAGHFFGNLSQGASVVELIGRFWACLQFGHYRQHRRVIAAGQPAEAPRQTAAGEESRARKGLRIDAAHPTGRSSATPVTQTAHLG